MSATGASWTSRLLRDRARPGDVGGDAGDPLDLVGRHNRAAGKAPDAAVNDPNAEAIGFGRAVAAAAAESAARKPTGADICPLRNGDRSASGCV